MSSSLNLLPILLLILSQSFFSQNNEDELLSLERIYTKHEFRQNSLGKIQWFNNGESYTLLESNNDGSNKIVKYDSQSGVRSILISSEQLVTPNSNKPLKIYSYEFSDDLNHLLIFTNTKRVWRKNTRGDYWILNRKTNELKKLGGSGVKPSSLMFAKFSPNLDKIAYVRDNNIFIESISGNNISQLTFDGSVTTINGTFDWVYEEEFKIRNGFRWSPDGKKIAFWQLNADSIGVFNMINNTDSIYSEIIPVQYPKVGTKNSACKVGVVDISSKEIIWLKVPGDQSNNYIPRMDWADNADELIIQQLNRLQNKNSIFIGDAKTGNVENIFIDQDDAWVEVVNDIKWFKNGYYFTWLSERDGWRQIYLISRDGNEIKKITQDGYDVISIVGIDQIENCIFFIASPENPTQRYLYRKSIFENSEKELITPSEFVGTSSYNISPNFDWAFHTYSNINTPEKINFISLPDHKTIRNLISNDILAKKIKELNIRPIEFFKVKTVNDIMLDGWKILPPDFDKSQKYPILFYVYGEPANQTVNDSWTRRYFWHQMLAQQGYIVMSIDNRGTPAPRGREFRKCIYGQIGILASADQADATRTVAEWEYVDKERIGIWGWSGGGSMSLNAIFRYPELYKTAIAIASVADQRLYDTIYQERYMGLPSTNPDGYYKGSPVNFAHQLKGNLLLIHGTADDNVHYQNTELIINKLIEHNKIFSVMPYPNRSHSIKEGKNTTRHVYETMLNFIMNNL